MDLRARARRLKQELVAVHLAYHDPRTPWYAKALLALVIAYALSPLDLIPDSIPVLGYLDDVILLPLGIALALWLIPRAVMDDCRRRANEQLRLPVSKTGAVLVVCCWLAALAAVAWLIVRLVSA
ncbi:MAG TPA: YkvA family protein [bacterium]|nr:YkvA family protein [bacterium]